MCREHTSAQNYPHLEYLRTSTGSVIFSRDVFSFPGGFFAIKPRISRSSRIIQIAFIAVTAVSAVTVVAAVTAVTVVTAVAAVTAVTAIIVVTAVAVVTTLVSDN